MKRLFPVLMTLALVGCQDFTGQLKVDKSFEAISKPGGFSKARTVVIPEGRHEIALDGKLSGEVHVSLKLEGKKEVIRMKIPKNRLPEERGKFEVSAAELGQPFDIRGELDTDRSRTRSERDVEVCTRTITREICSSNGHYGEHNCRTETITVTGQQQVEYHYVTTEQDIEVDLIHAQNGRVAEIKGHNSSTNKVYTYRGICF